MELKTKNRLTVLLLGSVAVGLYLYALPAAVFEQLAKVLRSLISG